MFLRFDKMQQRKGMQTGKDRLNTLTKSFTNKKTLS